MNALGLLAAAAALFLLQALLFRAFGLSAVRYRRYFTKSAVFEGQRVEMVEELSNAKLLPVPWVRVEARMSRHLVFKSRENLSEEDDAFQRSLFSLGPWRKITRTHSVLCAKRGCYSVESVSLSSGDLFGFSGRTACVSNPMELLVYPRLPEALPLAVPSRRWQGDVVVRRFIEPDPFLVNGIRPFQAGDMPRDVHWAATARTGALQVKSRDYTASPRLLLVLNVQLTEDQWGELNAAQCERIEQCVALAAAYADWGHRNGVETGLLCNGRFSAMNDRAVETPMGAGPAHRMDMLEAMARLKILRRRSFASYLEDEVIARGVSGADILVLSAYWSSHLEEKAGRLRRMENSVTWVDPEGGAHGG